MKYMNYHLSSRDIKMLHCLKHYNDNDIELKFLSNASGNTNSIIGYKLAYFRAQNNFNILDIC